MYIAEVKVLYSYNNSCAPKGSLGQINSILQTVLKSLKGSNNEAIVVPVERLNNVFTANSIQVKNALYFLCLDINLK